MATHMHKLTAAEVAKLIKARKEGRHSDGGGLYLQIIGASASWLFRYVRQGRERQLGLGPAHTVSLVDAREAARKHREALLQDEDPQIARDRSKATAPTVTFAEATGQFLELYRQGLRNAKHREQWGNTLERYAFPKLGALPVSEITRNQVLRVLEPLWSKKPESGSRMRARIEKVLGFATAKDWRTGPNPAAWKNNLEHILPAIGKVRDVRHHAALDYRELPAFVAELRAQNGVAPRALEFLILTVCRTADLIGVPDRGDKPPLRWSDIDFKECIWSIPKSKASAMPHKKPLSPRCMEILAEMRRYKLDPVIVFPSLDRPGRALSTSGLRSTLHQAMERKDITVHGFRATFKTWAGEDTPTPIEVIESSLAHGVISDKVEAAYRRQDFFAKRRKLMEAWSEFADGGSERTGGVVVPMRPR